MLVWSFRLVETVGSICSFGSRWGRPSDPSEELLWPLGPSWRPESFWSWRSRCRKPSARWNTSTKENKRIKLIFFASLSDLFLNDLLIRRDMIWWEYRQDSNFNFQHRTSWQFRKKRFGNLEHLMKVDLKAANALRS